jgi:hypothetical protein
MFVGRTRELQALRGWWDDYADRPALVWGRRRVGKTSLIERFAADIPRVVFHTGAGEPALSELALLSRAVGRAFPSDPRDVVNNPYHD